MLKALEKGRFRSAVSSNPHVDYPLKLTPRIGGKFVKKKGKKGEKP